MSTEAIANYIQTFANYAETAPIMIFVFIIIFMAIESSFIPFPSEVVMIPAGFLAYRCTLLTGIHSLDLAIAIVCGLFGSMIGAYVNYFLSAWLGRPFLHKYGKYFFLSEKSLDRAEELFREYGEIVTFVCRLLPAIRQLISIPAGISKMNLKRFTLFTALGAGLWTTVLALIGYYFGHLAGDMTYQEMVSRGAQMIKDHYGLIFLCVAVLFVAYVFIHKKIMGNGKKEASSGQKA